MYDSICYRFDGQANCLKYSIAIKWRKAATYRTTGSFLAQMTYSFSMRPQIDEVLALSLEL
jgi:hypothetical protein